MTYQVIYSSESSTPLQQDDLEAILEQARRNNAKNAITGALVYVDGIFFQILEGEPQIVRSLMEKIDSDVRHETVTILREVEIPAALFSDWKMAYVSATAEQIAQWAGLSEVTAIPQVLKDIRQTPSLAAEVTKGILAVLQAEPHKPIGRE